MRKSFISIVVMLFVVSAFAQTGLRALSSNNTAKIGCLLYIDGAIYELDDLKEESDYTIALNNSTTQQIDFEVCQAVKNPCAEGQETFAVLKTSDGQGNITECKALTSDQEEDVMQSLLEDGNSSSGINITYTKGEVVQSDNLTMSFELQLQCNKDMNKSINLLSAYENGPDQPHRYTVLAESKFACPTIDVSLVWNFIEENKIIFIAVFGLIGMFMTFVGKRFITYSLFLIGLVGVFITIMAVAFGFFIKADTEDNLKWAIVAISTVLGLLVGFAISRQGAQKAEFFIMGGILGVVLGALVYSTFLVKMDISENNGDMVSIGAMVAGGLVFGILGLCLTDVIEIISTSFFGSFMVLRAVGLQVGGYPSYKELALLWHNNQYGQYPTEIYMYLIGTVVLAFMGMCVQFKHHIDNKKKQEQDEENDMWKASLQNTQQFI